MDKHVVLQQLGLFCYPGVYWPREYDSLKLSKGAVMQWTSLVISAIGFWSIAQTTLAGGTVTVALRTVPPLASQEVTRCSAITWQISAEVSSGDNLGLAMISADLVQDPSNPAFLDIAPATSDPMERFAAPLGISNPVPDGLTSPGFNGTPVGPIGAKNLLQIGGAQNTLGAALGSIGIQTTVLTNVGQSGPIVIATGTLRIPDAPSTSSASATYRFVLSNVRASTIDSAMPVGGITPVSAAAIQIAVEDSGFALVLTSMPCGANGAGGDFNCNGMLEVQDIFDFLNAWFVGDLRADVNHMEGITVIDIFDFLNSWLEGCI